MIIATTYKDEHVYEDFGKTPQMKIYEIGEDKTIKQKIVDIDFTGHKKMVQFLKENKADVLICGDIEIVAFKTLERAGIKVYSGYSDFADVCVVAFLKGKLYKADEPTYYDDDDCGGDCSQCTSECH